MQEGKIKSILALSRKNSTILAPRALKMWFLYAAFYGICNDQSLFLLSLFVFVLSQENYCSVIRRKQNQILRNKAKAGMLKMKTFPVSAP